MNTEQIYKAWQAVGADLAGLKWDDFVAALAQPEQEPVALPCCGYADASAIKWNPYNQVVQCHNCGQTYTAPPQREPLTEALAQPEQEPSGWRLVPVEPTQEMLRATEVGPVNLPMFCWKAMLSAAPKPPQRTWQGLTDEEELIPMPLFDDWPGGWQK